jgi:hypothetical protein
MRVVSSVMRITSGREGVLRWHPKRMAMASIKTREHFDKAVPRRFGTIMKEGIRAA